MKLEGWISYPYDSEGNVVKARWITGDEKYDPKNVTGVDDPLLAEANGVKTAYQFKRWGDNYFVLGSSTGKSNQTNDTACRVCSLNTTSIN